MSRAQPAGRDLKGVDHDLLEINLLDILWKN